jgi:hypothetical protein
MFIPNYAMLTGLRIVRPNVLNPPPQASLEIHPAGNGDSQESRPLDDFIRQRKHSQKRKPE